MADPTRAIDTCSDCNSEEVETEVYKRYGTKNDGEDVRLCDYCANSYKPSGYETRAVRDMMAQMFNVFEKKLGKKNG